METKMGLIYRKDWDSIDDTDTKAEPVEFEIIRNATVLTVAAAEYRNARLSEVSFEISPEQKRPLSAHGVVDPDEKLEVRVLCLWFGRYPQVERFITVKVYGEYTVETKDNVEVVRNIARL
jgi:hypothetical protein